MATPDQAEQRLCFDCDAKESVYELKFAVNFCFNAERVSAELSLPAFKYHWILKQKLPSEGRRE